YFYKSKKDPSDLNDEVLKKEIANGIARIISFIRVQDKDFLLPLITETNGLTDITKKHHVILDAIAKQLVKLAEQSDATIKNTVIIHKQVANLESRIEDKEALKQKFSGLLEHYIKHRDVLTWN